MKTDNSQEMPSVAKFGRSLTFSLLYRPKSPKLARNVLAYFAIFCHKYKPKETV